MRPSEKKATKLVRQLGDHGLLRKLSVSEVKSATVNCQHLIAEHSPCEAMKPDS
jgi:hypothetical protein